MTPVMQYKKPLKRAAKAPTLIATSRTFIDGLRSDIDMIERAWTNSKICLARIEEHAGGSKRLVVENAAEMVRHMQVCERIEDAYNEWQRKLTTWHFKNETAAKDGGSLRIQLGAALSTMRQPHPGTIVMDKPAEAARAVLAKLESVLNVE